MKNKTIAFSLRIDESTYKKLKAVANKEMRSINSQCEYFLLQSIELYEKENELIPESE